MNMNDEAQIINNLSDLELINHFIGGCKNIATGINYQYYNFMRNKILNNKNISNTKKLPSFISTCLDNNALDNFMKDKFPRNYKGRREYIDESFLPLLNFLNLQNHSPIEESIIFDESHIHSQWQKAVARKDKDPDGAITAARTLIESVLKYILDKQNIEYGNNIELSELYKKVAKELNMAPEQHQEQIFKQILGGANGIISGLGALRNKLGDAHGTTLKTIKPLSRHSELAVNLAGSMSIFIYRTFKETKIKEEEF